MRKKTYLRLAAPRAAAIRGRSAAPSGEPPPARHRPTGKEAALDAAFRIRLMQISGNFRVTTGMGPDTH